MKRVLSIVLGSALIGLLASCSAILDFSDETDLPCPCNPNYVCVHTTNRCFPAHSVADYKSCSTDADNPDDLCGPNSVCYNLKGRGSKCLPKCTPVNYGAIDSATAIAGQCSSGHTCWAVPETGIIGVCGDGECQELGTSSPCDQGKTCATFNGAGVCFTPCAIFSSGACAGNTLCQPLGTTSIAACVPAGTRTLGDPCSTMAMCAPAASGRPLVCDVPANSGATPRCLPLCNPANAAGNCTNGENCQFSRPGVDPQSGANLGVCVKQ